MKTTINGLTYDTDTADIIAVRAAGVYPDPSNWEKTLYRMKTGDYFLYETGGSTSIISWVTEAEALKWCEEHHCQSAIDDHFNSFDRRSMKPALIALVFMGDPMDNFFIENAPPGPPEKWINKFVNDVTEVEFVEVYEIGKTYAHWANPDSNPE